MKKCCLLLLLVNLVIGLSGTVYGVSLYVDSAPNVYGSPDYPGWEAATFAAVANGTFVNMSNGINPANVGTTDFEIQDEVVYSFGDLGKRLTWIYWIEGETVAGLDGRFEISLFNVWNGSSLDFYDDYYGSTWLEPTKWVDYDIDGDGIIDGVIGTAGMAWWGANGINTPEALAADIALWALAEEDWTFTARLDGVEVSLTSHRDPVPEPSALFLLGSGLAGLVGLSRKRLQQR